jgi:hypothetical protein
MLVSLWEFGKANEKSLEEGRIFCQTDCRFQNLKKAKKTYKIESNTLSLPQYQYHAFNPHNGRPISQTILVGSIFLFLMKRFPKYLRHHPFLFFFIFCQ